MSLHPTNIKECKRRQVYGILNIESPEQIVFREEIPPVKLVTALRELYEDNGGFNHILFEERGYIELVDRRKHAVLRFELAALSHHRKNWFANFLQINWIDYLGALSIYQPNQGMIAVRKPSFSAARTNIYLRKNPAEEKENRLELNLGRCFNQVKLVINAELSINAQDQELENLVDTRKTSDSDAENPGENPVWLYKQPSAYGYKVIR